MEIRTGSSDSNSSRHKSSSFESVQRISNESHRKIKRRKKENIEYKRSCEFGSGGPERKIQKGSEHRVVKRAVSSNYNTNDLPKLRKRGRTEETVMPSTSRCNLRPRNGTRVESQPIIEMMTQQGGPVRARNSRGKHYNSYIEERAR
ncbi:uncharacterized protein TNCV_4691391 [Trichonephila clavipes]|nr:uncharacterized protein TNCV_4691391 [Trichonephila clavipes]